MLRFLDRQKTGKNEEAIELSAIEIKGTLEVLENNFSACQTHVAGWMQLIQKAQADISIDKIYDSLFSQKSDAFFKRPASRGLNPYTQRHHDTLYAILKTALGKLRAFNIVLSQDYKDALAQGLSVDKTISDSITVLTDLVTPELISIDSLELENYTDMAYVEKGLVVLSTIESVITGKPNQQALAIIAAYKNAGEQELLANAPLLIESSMPRRM